MRILYKTLYIKHDSGNIGHYFNDHLYSSIGYYLMNKKEIENIYIELKDITCINFIHNVNECIKNKTFLSSHNNSVLNLNMILLFFYDENINIIVDCINNNNYNFNDIIKIESDRFFDKFNFMEVFDKLNKNYKSYIKNNNIISDRVDVTVLYRNNNVKSERNIYNIDELEKNFICNNISYKLFDTSKFFDFFEIINLYNFSDNIIAFHGCELTYGIFMDKNTKIIELTNIGHLESWWNHMQNKFIKFGLKYSRLEVPTINKNLYLDDAICENIINSLTLKQFDYFISLGERCNNTISLHNIGYKKGSYPFDYIISDINFVNKLMFEDKSFSEIYFTKSFFLFPHHNKKNDETEIEYIDRLVFDFNKKLLNLCEKITSNKRILFMYTITYDYNFIDNLIIFVKKLIDAYKYNNFKILVISDKDNTYFDTIPEVNDFKNKFIFIKYKLDRNEYNNYNGTDYGDYKLRQFIGNYLLYNFNCNFINKPLDNKYDNITNIVPIGSRCINKGILDKYGYSRISNVFDSINIKYLKNTYDSVISNFDNLISYKYLKELKNGSNEIITSNILYDTNDTKHDTFPHFNLFDKKMYQTFSKRVIRFTKYKNFNSLFIFTITDNINTIDDIIYWGNLLKIYFNRNGFNNKLLIIDLFTNDNESERYKLLLQQNDIYIYSLIIHSNSYTGGFFANDIDNENYINIIKIFVKNDIFLSKDEIDCLQF